MTQKLKRYEFELTSGYIYEDKQGEYVKFEDYQKLLEQLGKAEAVISKYANEPYIFDEEDDDTEQLHIGKPWRHTSGKRARQYFKEKGES